ncbi:glycosyltransferase family protein [Chlamydiales bacterium]|nr:glycosyltransferase family protein [Chlamydiales bacterium]
MLEKKRIALIVQARMGSTRLPGKVLREVLGKPLLVFLMERLKRVQLADDLIIATTTLKEDDQIEKVVKDFGVKLFRGSSDNVLERYYEAAKEVKAEIVIRITADCPLIDPSIIERGVHLFLKNQQKVDYLSNCRERTYPRGMDVEIFTLKTLEEAYNKHVTVYDEEHVTPYIYHHPEKYRLDDMKYLKDYHHYRLTCDTLQDFTLIETLIKMLYPVNPKFTLEDIIQILEKHPDWVQINTHVKQKNETN